MSDTSREATAGSSLIRAALCLVILPNAVFWLLGMEIFLSRSLVNLDYLLLAMIVIWLPYIFRLMGFTLLVALDLLTSTGPAFHFSYRSMLQSVLDTLNMQPSLFIPVALAILIGSGILATIICRYLPAYRPRWIVSLLLFVSALGLQVLDKQLSANVLSVNFSTTTFGNILRVVIADQQRTTPELYALPEDQAVASDEVWQLLKKNPDQLPENILVVVVESWGRYNEEAVNDALFSQFNSLQDTYQITSGYVPFKGSTVPGELRELCRLGFSGVHPPVESLKDFTCLPEQLASLGYQLLGMHGYSGSMFKRRDWYPVLFGEGAWFVNDLDRQLTRRSRCGVSFRGVCDADVMDYLTARHVTRAGELQFSYLLTLNAHLPVYQPDSSNVDCSLFATTQTNSQHCFLYQHVAGLIESVRTFAVENAHSSLIVMVGDHMPPFVKTSDRALYDDAYVPFVVLKSR